jgi:hypothetical protein
VKAWRICCIIVMVACDGTVDPTDTDPDTDPDTEPPAVVQLYINEFMADNVSSLVLHDTFYPDWIELYNPGDQVVDLDGWQISDHADEPDRHVFSSTLVVPSKGFLLLYADGSAELGADHLQFGLKLTGEEVALTDPYGRRIDWVKFEAQEPDTAAARERDGDPDADWIYLLHGTPGASNSQ